MAAFFAGSITSNLKFTAKVPLLMKATSNDEKPTQGYNLQEISTISKSSLPNCQSLLTFLLGRLEKKDPRIKFKVLHLMKYLVINGHSEFRAQLRHNAEAVKKAVNFQGELDSVHGDGLNLKVQQAASELEKLLFDVDNPEVESIYKSMLGPDQSGKKMQGFGYTAAQEIKKETSFMDTLMIQVKKSSSEIFNKSRAPQKNVRFNEYEQTSTTPEAQYIPVDIEDSGVHPSSNFSSFDGNDEDEICDENEMNSGHYYERKLVQNITAEGGLTKIPSKEMLKDFVNKSSSLEIPVILEILDERLQSSSLNVQLKSLCVVEYMLRGNLSNVPREINEHCQSIHLLAESQDLTVQAKANKIVLAIASCLKQDENQPASRAQVVIPPNYNEAKEIPKMKDKSSSETDHKVTNKTDFNALFSGMNLSAGVRPDFAVNRKLVEPTEPLIDIENTTASTVLENSDFLADTNESNSKQNPTENDKQTNGEASNLFSSKHTNSEVHANQFALAASSETQNSNNFDLMSLETSETSILDFSTPLQNRDLSLLESNELKSNLNVHDMGQEPDKRTLRQEGRLLFNQRETTARPGVSWTNNVDVLNWKQSNSTSSSSRTNSTQNIELLNTEPQNPSPPKSLPQKASHINPNRTVQCIPQNQNSDLLSFQREPRSQALPGGLALPTNSSSASPRRPFPKDMKSETDGFDFIRKSTKADAFSFINDEIQASKTKQK